MGNNIEEEVHKIANKWDNGEYDDFKVVILDCRRLLKFDEVQKNKQLLMIVEATLRSSTTAYQEFIDQNPSERNDKEGLIDKRYLYR